MTPHDGGSPNRVPTAPLIHFPCGFFPSVSNLQVVGNAQVASSDTLAGQLAAGGPSLLWSTNTWLKHYIQMVFGANRHYAWCSPVFDGGAQQRYALGAGQDASSDPAAIYRTLHHAVRTSNGHNEKIRDQKKTLRGLAVKWSQDGSITTAEREEIFSILKYSQIEDFKPLIYVIPYAPVAARVSLVPRERRAGHHREYIVQDLDPSEFDIIEPIPCP
jgi:hypothetical protein